jgi:hypothetical protein
MATPEPRIRTRGRRTARLRSGFGASQNELSEVDEIGNHILERLLRNLAQNSSDVPRYTDWVTSRFAYPLRALLVKAGSNTRGYLFLNLIVIGGGFATSGIAVAAGTGHKSSTAAWIVFGVGLAVALAGGVSQILRPGFRATQRITLAMELREEGWAFAMCTKDYPEAEPQVAFERFEQRVSNIHRRAAQVIGLEPESRTGQGRTRTTSRPRGTTTSPATGT